MDEQKIIINGLEINYKNFGDGDRGSVLILHGWGRGADSWIRFGRFLASKGYRVIVPDLPGFGKSQAPDVAWAVADYLKFVENFVAELGLGKMYLIGHSFGGGLAAVFAAHNQETILKLVFVDAAVIRKERLNLRQQAAKTLAAGKSLFMRFPFADKLRPFAEKMVYRIAGNHDYEKTTGAMRETFKNILGEDLSSAVGFLKKPVLIIWGSADRSTPVQDAHQLKHKITGSLLEVIDNCGHNPHLTHPAELCRMVDAFLGARN